MTMRAEVWRDTQTGRSSLNTPLPPLWEMWASVPCFAWTTSERLAIDSGKSAVVEELRAEIPSSADITTRDRWQYVTDRQGEIIFLGPFEIDTDEPKIGHRELRLRRVNG